MKQAVLRSPGEIVFQEVSYDISLAPDQLLIQIKTIGICGSDIHAYKGKHPFTPLPVVQGHEYSAVVVAVGDRVSRFRVGDKVTGRPQLTCGQCKLCLSGRYNVCQELRVEGFQAGGVAQDYFKLPEVRAYLIEAHVSFEEIALIEPAAVAAHATAMIADIQSKKVMISGAGPIGILIAQFAKARGAKEIIVSDFNESRLHFLSQIGIPNTINLSQETFEEGIQRILGDDTFDVGIEAVGHQLALNNLVNTIGKGGEIIIVGVYEEFPRINMGFVGEHELTLRGSMMYKHEDYLEAIHFMNTGVIDLKSMITHRFDFKDYNEAYGYIEQNASEIIKVIIDVN